MSKANSQLSIIILAAGKGTRMRSAKAKVLHELAGRSMLQHVLDTAHALQPRHIAVVVGHQAQQVQACVADEVVWVEQSELLGTGHAVQLAMRALSAQVQPPGQVLILYADVPLVSEQTLRDAVGAAETGAVGLVTADFADPAELGRVVRTAQGEIQRIVEFKDADTPTRAIHEINSGIIAAPADLLAAWLQQLQPDNSQGEYYLTDIIALAAADGININGIKAPQPQEVTGVNDRSQLAELERVYQRREAQRLMREGVSIADPARLDIRGRVSAGEDCFFDINVVLQGDVSLGKGVHIGPGAVVIDSKLGDHCEVKAHSVVEGTCMAERVSVGPFARIRPGTVLDDDVKVGNFVETKKAHLGAGTKAGHLAYLGDATVGAGCNIGAGAVTCNYDGISKHATHIGNNVFVGTNTTLVAPLDLKDRAFVAAGSTVTSTVEDGDLAVGRAKQRNIKGWVRPDQRKDKT